jgi:eukaryotic-like serine/threonine-protein kinase
MISRIDRYEIQQLRGDDTHEYLARDPLLDRQVVIKLPLPTRLRIIEDVCAGLAHAHAGGTCHLETTPGEILIDGNWAAKILFPVRPPLDGSFVGTPSYMSPEQLLGRQVDQRTDLFAVGAVLYETIALRRAFEGGVQDVARHVIHSDFMTLTEVVPGVDVALATIVSQALHREPSLRYQDADTMRRDIESGRARL